MALEKSKHTKPYAWIPDLGWEDAVRLAEVSPNTFGNLLEDIEENETSWKEVIWSWIHYCYSCLLLPTKDTWISVQNVKKSLLYCINFQRNPVMKIHCIHTFCVHRLIEIVSFIECKS